MEEKNTTTQSLAQCGYSKRSIEKSERTERPVLKPQNRKQRLIRTKAKVLWSSLTWEGISERISRVFKRHGHSTAMKPHCTLRNILIHPKDERDSLQTAETVYEIPYKNCSKTYIGVTGWLFKTWLMNMNCSGKDQLKMFHTVTHTKKTKQNKTKQNKTKQNETKQNKTKKNKNKNIQFRHFQVSHFWARRRVGWGSNHRP